MRSAKGHGRFAPNSDRESGFPANGHVRFTPQSGHCHERRPRPASAKVALGPALKEGACPYGTEAQSQILVAIRASARRNCGGGCG
jgi:hypothetical protein